MTRFRRSTRLLTAMAALALSLTGASSAAADTISADSQDAPEACTQAWRLVRSPNVGSGDNGLAALDVVSSTDIWAVGNSLSGDVRSTLVEHWDGARWSVVPSPNGAEPVN